MLTELYIEALLTDEDLADQVWELWVDGLIVDCAAQAVWREVSRTSPNIPPPFA